MAREAARPSSISSCRMYSAPGGGAKSQSQIPRPKVATRSRVGPAVVISLTWVTGSSRPKGRQRAATAGGSAAGAAGRAGIAGAPATTRTARLADFPPRCAVSTRSPVPAAAPVTCPAVAAALLTVASTVPAGNDQSTCAVTSWSVPSLKRPVQRNGRTCPFPTCTGAAALAVTVRLTRSGRSSAYTPDRVPTYSRTGPPAGGGACGSKQSAAIGAGGSARVLGTRGGRGRAPIAAPAAGFTVTLVVPLC